MKRAIAGAVMTKTTPDRPSASNSEPRSLATIGMPLIIASTAGAGGICWGQPRHESHTRHTPVLSWIAVRVHQVKVRVSRRIDPACKKGRCISILLDDQYRNVRPPFRQLVEDSREGIEPRVRRGIDDSEISRVTRFRSHRRESMRTMT